MPTIRIKVKDTSKLPKKMILKLKRKSIKKEENKYKYKSRFVKRNKKLV